MVPSKRLNRLLLPAICVVSMAACGGQSGSPSSPASGGSTVATGGSASSGAGGSGGRVDVTATGGAKTSSGGQGGPTTGSGGRVVATGGAGGSGTGGASSSGGAGGAPSANLVNGSLYVSPTGDDSNPGTMAQPLRTIAKARDLVRPLLSKMTQDITIVLRGGTYPLASTLAFTGADSGQGGFYVKYIANTGERPLITGGQPITGWKVFDSANNVYATSGITSNFRQLYVNGQKAVRARSPNPAAGGGPNFYRYSGVDKNGHAIQIPSSYVANWKNLTKVEMHLMAAWADEVLRLASVTTSGNTASLKFQNPEDGIMFVRSFPLFGPLSNGDGQPFYLENAYEFLDQPGEWYLDEAAATLYYKPRSGEDMTKATVVAPMLENVVKVMGADATTDPAHHIWFQGLTFAHSTYLLPSTAGFLDLQAGQYNVGNTRGNTMYVGHPAAGVYVANAHHIQFERNMFAQMAATGLDFNYGTHDDLIEGNVFTDLGGTGISIGKYVANESTEMHTAYNPADKTEICTTETVKDNYVNNVTTEIQGAVGIGAGYPRFIDIEHNEVANVNYTGISVGFGWTAAVNAMSNNKINYNNVHDITHVLADAGAIYTLSNQGPSSQEQYNYLHDFKKSQWADYADHGIYMDEQTSGYTVAHNVLVNCPSIFQNSVGPNNTLTDNAGMLASTISAAGLESAYADIKANVTIPVPAFAP
ncbi:MAG: right-handed parallel beta-helix repeat-containing protein [Polyangia bacterium]